MHQCTLHSFNVTRSRAWIICLISVVLWLACFNVPAWAHKVTIFAWVEGDTVHTQSKFSGGKRAQDSTVVVYDKEGNQLLEGKTNENGEFSFKVPKKTELKVVLKASMGHLAEWTIPAEEITAAGDITQTIGPEAGTQAPPQEVAQPVDGKASGEAPEKSTIGLSREEIKGLIDDSLDRKLAPITNMLADSQDHGPTVSEVIGGIGYIFGLVGVGLYFRNRRQESSGRS
jgi:nickel transport protein